MIPIANFAKNWLVKNSGINISIVVGMHIENWMLVGPWFPQRKLVRDKNVILEKVFWKMFFATRDIKELKVFWLTYFMMTTNMKDYFIEDNEEIRKVLRVKMEGQFEHDLSDKPFRF